jgi:hypothetical protein
VMSTFKNNTLKVQISLRLSYKKRSCQNLCLLASTKGSSISTSSTYILFLTEMQKGKSCEMDLPLFKNDITGSELTVKMLDTVG